MAEIPDAEAVCRNHDVEPDPPAPHSKVGIALGTLDRDPLNGMRIPAEADTCGWYIWGGELSDAPDFFQPLHVSHLSDHCPRVLPFLSLPAGFRFLLGENSHVDVWHDENLLNP